MALYLLEHFAHTARADVLRMSAGMLLRQLKSLLETYGADVLVNYMGHRLDNRAGAVTEPATHRATNADIDHSRRFFGHSGSHADRNWLALVDLMVLDGTITLLDSSMAGSMTIIRRGKGDFDHFEHNLEGCEHGDADDNWQHLITVFTQWQGIEC